MEHWVPSSSLAEELVVANGYMYGVGLEEVGHQCLVLYQFKAVGRCMMRGNDKKAVPCLHPGLKVSDFSGRDALLVTPFGHWGLGSLDWHYIVYCGQQVIKINVLTSPDFADDTVVRGRGTGHKWRR